MSADSENEEEPPKLEVGKPIPPVWEGTINRNPDTGGIVLFAAGRQGCGKTSLLLTIANAIVRRPEPRELVIWRGLFSCQFLKFWSWKLFIEHGAPVKFMENGHDIALPIVNFNGFDDLLQNLEFGKLNVVYFNDDAKWIDFVDWLLIHGAGKWISVFIDEVEDLVPYGAPGEGWVRNKKFSDAVKSARKQRLSIYSATQKPADVDWRFRAKVMIWAMLRGARKEKGIRIWQRAIDALKVGEAWICESGDFQKIRFDPYPPRREVVASKEITGESPANLAELGRGNSQDFNKIGMDKQK